VRSWPHQLRPPTPSRRRCGYKRSTIFDQIRTAADFAPAVLHIPSKTESDECCSEIGSEVGAALALITKKNVRQDWRTAFAAV